jgi:hypothetical protein
VPAGLASTGRWWSRSVAGRGARTSAHRPGRRSSRYRRARGSRYGLRPVAFGFGVMAVGGVALDEHAVVEPGAGFHQVVGDWVGEYQRQQTKGVKDMAMLPSEFSISTRSPRSGAWRPNGSGWRTRWRSCRLSTTPSFPVSSKPWRTATSSPLDDMPDDAVNLLRMVYSSSSCRFPSSCGLSHGYRHPGHGV